MRLTNKDFYKICSKAHRRNDKWQFLVVLVGITLIAAVTAYSVPTSFLDAAIGNTFWAFTWQGWVLAAPIFVYLIASVILWEKIEDTTLRFYRNIFRFLKVLEQ